jgi:hypothetical protein
MKDLLLFNKIIKISKKIKDEDKSICIFANNSLNICKAHPEYLNLFKQKKTTFLKNILIYLSKAIYMIILSIIKNLKIIKKNKIIKQSNFDVILISNLVSSGKNKNSDLYFNGVSEILKKKKIQYLKIFINNLGLNHMQKKFESTKNEKAITVNCNIGFLAIIEIYFTVLKKFIKFFFLSYQFRGSEHHIYKILSLEFLSPLTVNNLILKKKFEVLFSKYKCKNLVYTFEGFSWEKILGISFKKKHPKAKVIGYQFASLLKNQNLKDNNLNKIYHPDIVWTCGDINLGILKNEFKKVINIGTDRKYKKSIKETKNSFKFNCLVIPEGMNTECKKILNFSLLCAKKFPDINFVWRFHPLIKINHIFKQINDKKEFPKNIIISKKNLTEDINRSSFFLYRGSTAAITSLQKGLHPLYLNLDQSINIDPIYKFNKWKTNIDTVYDFEKFIKKKINKVLSENSKRKKGISFAKNYFMKLNSNKIYFSLDL